MINAVASKKMLYCPKCQQTYEESSQRFCDKDGVRLLSAPNAAVAAQKNANGVFSNLIGKLPQKQERDEKLASIPRFSPTEFSSVYNEIKTAESEPEVELELFPVSPASAVKPLPKPVQPLARIIKQSEIPSGTAAVGNRQTNPTGRLALTADNPRVLLGQTIKGRYYVVELLGQDESGIEYLAEDKISPPKKYVVRVLTKGKGEDELMESIYAEEKVWLSHVNHPHVVRVVDSGELLEGKQFLVTEHVEAGSLKDLLANSGQFNALRTARIIRQAANALSEVHENGILHRDLKPENILLTFNETGAEQVKLNGFGISDGKANDASKSFKAPEILEGRLATVAGDVFSLAAIAFQMLTERLPFGAGSEKEILRAEREGLKINPSESRTDLSEATDEVLKKALFLSPSGRYPKARDFGDAFYNAVSADAELLKNEPAAVKKTHTIVIEPEKIESDSTKNEIDTARQSFVNPVFVSQTESPLETAAPVAFEEKARDTDEIKTEAENVAADVAPVKPDISIKPLTNFEPAIEGKAEQSGAKINKSASEDLAWTRRSPEPPKTGTLSWLIFSILGLGVLLVGAWAIWSYAAGKQGEIDTVAQNTQAKQEAVPIDPAAVQTPAALPLDIEVPPLSRQIQQPANSSFFQNGKQSVKGDLVRNFLGFTLYYPNDWKVNEAKEAVKPATRGKFLDLSKTNADGKLLEQMLVSYYESKGTFKDDEPKFPQLVKETSETLTKLIPSYQVLSEGATTVNGWKAYEVKFQGAGTTGKGEKMIVWGRRLFIPVVRAGAGSGYEITMLATSLANNVKGVDDIGNNDELAGILETFEPNQSY